MSARSAFHISARKEVYLNTLSHDGGASADLKYIDQKVLCAKTTKDDCYGTIRWIRGCLVTMAINLQPGVTGTSDSSFENLSCKTETEIKDRTSHEHVISTQHVPVHVPEA